MKGIEQNTTVVMSDWSLKRLKDVVVGDMLVSFVDGVQGESEVTNLTSNDETRIHEIYHSMGNLNCGREQLFLTPSGEFSEIHNPSYKLMHYITDSGIEEGTLLDVTRLPDHEIHTLITITLENNACIIADNLLLYTN
ncbi:MAG: hypothetical protein H8D23_17845 [Candidatus Brocadiales bacterium]|nr:hypothetical protein [Candidatus Brocadiales bacterium]